jgi:hypothetical protein
MSLAPKRQGSHEAEPNDHGNTKKKKITKCSTAKSSGDKFKRHPKNPLTSSAAVGMYARLIQSRISTREVPAVRFGDAQGCASFIFFVRIL